ncbi:polysaccharide biosynthesis/export family protein [Paraburkholderia caballeronis]|uniref:polysaccharide biosynthesis/export family protein n=1 Tax=Paraburkholderia caballeronis TaxID=416943 RepID=UPI000B823148|nr:polysaccharide biosynthesis/export family protein [Paraburkholderia caballeronis]
MKSFARHSIIQTYRVARPVSLFASLICPLLVAACSAIPTSGPSTRAIVNSAANSAETEGGVQIVDVNYDVAKKLLDERRSADFSVKFGQDSTYRQQFGLGDAVEVTIWEAPPAALFGTPGGVAEIGNGRGMTLPDQVVDSSGNITVPFAGPVRAAGRTPDELQRDIATKLRGIAHDPQVLVRLSKNATSYVTVVGDVVSSTRVPLTPHGERLLDALASAGGVREAVDKVTIQLTRNNVVASLPLENVIRDTSQNVPLHAGDVVTALFQPYSFTALGAAGKNQEVNFEAQGITLAQAIARAGGLQDSRADAQGVFVFRFEKPDALTWPDSPVRTTPDGKVPVVYRINLRDPNTFFVAQSFMMNNNDVLYVSNAPVAELQKFLNLVFSVAYPVVNSVNAFK